MLRVAGRIVALTGAGISAESGIPTFRGAGGLWKQFRAEQLATPTAFARDPQLVSEWYDWRRSVCAAAKPNRGHIALARFEEQTPGFTLVTQNVDGLHERAGSRRVLRLHGDIWTLRCAACGGERRDETVPLPELPPRCRCGGLMRPGVVWFGEALPYQVWQQAERAAGECEVLLVAGTSAIVYPAAGLIDLARTGGARVIEVNLEETPYSAGVTISLRGRAGDILPQLLQAC
jgi:NAD-dependent deacetylase